MKQVLSILLLLITTTMYSQNTTCDRLVNQGFELLSQGNLSLAIDKYNEALKIEPKRLEAHYGLGVAYSAICLKDGSFCNEAIKHFLETEKIKPGYRFTYRNIATCYIKTEQYEKAVDYCNKAILQDNTDGESYFYRGVSYIHLNKKEKGCEDLKHALKLGYDIAKIELQKYCQSTSL
jgi:tetratricopeptide (TPR) repeat protein